MIDSDGRHYDKLGRQVPHQLNALTFARAVRGFKEQLSTTQAMKAGDVLQLACACGVEHELSALLVNACSCGRFFINGGGHHALVAHPGAPAPNPLETVDA